MHRVLAAGGLEAVGLDDGEALELHRHMTRTRRFDERAIALQRRGWMSGYPPFRGQEASQVGAAWAMEADDWLFPTYRSNAMLLTLGVDMVDVLLFRRGYSEFARDVDRPRIFPQAVPIASHIPHAVGAGMAATYDDADHAVVCYFGDGATSEGDFHEGANFAGVFETPTLLFCENNHWAISVPETRQTASDTLAVKASAYGFDGVRVDGTDPLAVADLVADRLRSVRAGDPVLIESLTYRHGAHTTADDPERYRDDVDVPDWRRRDPLERYREYLREAGLLDDEAIEAVEAAVEAELEDAIEAAEAVPPPDPEQVFDAVFTAATPRQDRQRDDMLAGQDDAPSE